MWGLTFSGAGGERGVGRVPGQGLFPSRKGGCPGHWPRATCTPLRSTHGDRSLHGHSPEAIGRHPNEFVTLWIALDTTKHQGFPRAGLRAPSLRGASHGGESPKAQPRQEK